MATATIDYPPEMLAALGKRPPEAVREIQLMAALKLFESGRISSGLAAKLAGMSRTEFLMQCGRYGVTVFQQTAEEVLADAEAVVNASGGWSVSCRRTRNIAAVHPRH